MKFVHLHTHSHYSLLDGLGKIDELIDKALSLKMASLALTDHGNLYGAIEFYKKAKAKGIKPILGVEIYVSPCSRFEKKSPKEEKNFHLTLLAENKIGWQNLLKIVSSAHLEGFYYKPRADKELLKKFSKGLIALSGCPSGEIPKLILANRYSDAKNKIYEYQNIFGAGNFFLEIQPHYKIDDFHKINKGLVSLSKETKIPLVATYDVHYIEKQDKKYHQILLGIRNDKKENYYSEFAKDDFSMASESEVIAQGGEVISAIATTTEEMIAATTEAILKTYEISQRCNLELDLKTINPPKFPIKEPPFLYLKNLVNKRKKEYFPNPTEEVKKRIDYELEVVKKTNFADYFLIVADLVNWAKQKGIVVGPGRGSAVSSIVCYILGITEINPLKYDLLFERFLNIERIQVPDFDIDFADERRNEVVAYLREKYGQDKVAQIITFGKMAARAAIRDAGRALGYDYSFCDHIAKLVPFNFSLDDALFSVTELKIRYQKEERTKALIEAAKKLEGTVRHASVHACGTVISSEPLNNLLPLQYAPQDKNNIITQFEKDSVEDLGLLKIDLLGLKNLTTIEETLRLIKENNGQKIEIKNLILNDKATFELLQKGETNGVFQLESSGMQGYLKKLKPDKFEDIIAMVALYRPGPMALIPSYIKRKQDREQIAYLHPKLEPILKSTYGIAVYQEQVMQIAQKLAGFSLTEADILRKAIAKKAKTLLVPLSEKLIQGMIKKGITKKTAETIWKWIKPFGQYGFNKSHSASYALIAYWTAYLKTHFPKEFMTGLLNVSFNDMDRVAFLIKEAESVKIKILPPDVNFSSMKFVPEGENTIRFGLLAIKNVGVSLIEKIIEERMEKGPFENLADFLSRINHKDLNKKSLESLIKAGVLDSLGTPREIALENIEELLKFSGSIRKSLFSSQFRLFSFKPAALSLKLKPKDKIDFNQRLIWEKEYLGLYLSGHPLEKRLVNLNDKTENIQEILMSKKERITQVAGVILEIQRISTKTGAPMLFVKIEDLTSQIEILVFHEMLNKIGHLLQKNKVLLIRGKISLRNNNPKIICQNAREI